MIMKIAGMETRQELENTEYFNLFWHLSKILEILTKVQSDTLIKYAFLTTAEDDLSPKL